MTRILNWARSTLIVLLAMVGLLAAGGYLYFQYTLRGSIERGISERLGTDSRVGFARINLFPTGVHLTSVSIRNPGGFHDKYFLKARDLDLEIAKYERKSRLIRSPLMTIDDMDVWIERQGRRSNSKVIQSNFRRYDRKHGVTRDNKTKYIIRELRIRDLTAHLRAGSDSTTSEIPEIVLRNVGASRGGVTIGELAGIVTDAALRAALRNEVRRELDQRIEEKTHELRQKFDELFD